MKQQAHSSFDLTRPLFAAILCLAIVAGAVGCGPSTRVTTRPAASPSSIGPARHGNPSIGVATDGDVECSSGLPAASILDDPRGAALTTDYGPSRAPREGEVPITGQEAIARALEADGAHDPAPTAAGPRAVAHRMSYRAASKRTGGALAAGTNVNPQRCAWVVTVHESFVARAKPGTAPLTYDSYQVLIDEATGTGVALHAANALPDA